jgi:hypothetical protein
VNEYTNAIRTGKISLLDTNPSWEEISLLEVQEQLNEFSFSGRRKKKWSKIITIVPLLHFVLIIYDMKILKSVSILEQPTLESSVCMRMSTVANSYRI